MESLNPTPSVTTASHMPAQQGAGTQRERVPVLIFDSDWQMSRQIARRIANLVEEHQAAGRHVVLGLPISSTPIGVYRHLIRMHKEEGLDLSNVIAFNLDEYYPISPESLQSHYRFMRENFYDHVNIPGENIHFLKGDLDRDVVENHCISYEHAIRKLGGLDLVLLGIGRSGHIGFNEPGSSLETRTRLISLDELTRKDASSDFFGEENVPREAITMGVGTILDAREIIMIATGENKASIVRRVVEEEPDRHVTISFLQLHRNTTFYLDRSAAGELTREKTPWLVRDVKWDPVKTKRAVVWLSEKLGKAILHLEAADFYRNHLHDLLHSYENVDELCRSVFEDLRTRIMYQDSLPRGKRIILFSPHPDDDVISMGGMLDKLHANGNFVTVAYMTNGSMAVFDADVRRALRFVDLSHQVLGINGESAERVRKENARILNALKKKKPGESDIAEVRAVKAYIRYAEAIAGIEVLGMGEKNARFLDMPFYQTGTVRKDPIGEADIKVVLELLNEIQPDHIFVAGDLSDPHGTHRMCYDAIKSALERYNQKSKQPVKNGSSEQKNQKTQPEDRKDHARGPLVWLYRGAWQEWEVHRADVFLPLSKADLDRKIDAIFKHESQKDRAMFPGATDEREFWQRARDRNRQTADMLNRLGLPEFYAAEAFVTTYDMP